MMCSKFENYANQVDSDEQRRPYANTPSLGTFFAGGNECRLIHEAFYLCAFCKKVGLACGFAYRMQIGIDKPNQGEREYGRIITINLVSHFACSKCRDEIVNLQDSVPLKKTLSRSDSIEQDIDYWVYYLGDPRNVKLLTYLQERGLIEAK